MATYRVRGLGSKNFGTIRSQPDPASEIVARVYDNQVLTGDGTSEGSYYKVSNGWIVKANVQRIDNTDNASNLTEDTENYDSITSSGQTITTASNENYKRLESRYINAFGCPPQYNQVVDLQYIDEISPGIGRVFAETMLSFPSVLSLCPGKVDYLPGFSSDQQNSFLAQVIDIASGDTTILSRINAEDTTNKLNGKLYEFKQDYNGYISIVNVLCRATAMWLGIGDETMPHSNVKLKNFDYAWWTSRAGSPAQDSKSIFGETLENFKRSVGSAVGDDTYIHFFITHQGTSVSEDISTSTAASSLEELVNSSSLHSMSRNLEFLFGGAIGGNVEADLDAAINNIGDSNFIKSFGNLMKNYLKGGRLVFPQMIDDVNYTKSLSATLKFMSPYGEKFSIFLYCYVPLMHILAFALPKQIAQNMYTYPFLVRAFQRGWFNSDLAVITNLRITRGGSDNTSWTVDGLPTELEVSFDVTPLYSDLMVSSAKTPFMFLQNTSLAEYLATMCGVDLKANNLGAKVDFAITALQNYFRDIPLSLARGVTDTLAVKVQNLTQVLNR